MAQVRNQQLIKSLVLTPEQFFGKVAGLIYPPVNITTGKVFHDINTYRVVVETDAIEKCPYLVTQKGLHSLQPTFIRDVMCSQDPILAPVVLDHSTRLNPKVKAKEKPRVALLSQPIKIHVLQPNSSLGENGEKQSDSMMYRWITYYSVGHCNSSLTTYSWNMHKYIRTGLEKFVTKSTLSSLLWDILEYAVFVLDRTFDPTVTDMTLPLPHCCIKVNYIEEGDEIDDVYNKDVLCENYVDEQSDFEDLITLICKLLKRQMQVLGLKWREPKETPKRRGMNKLKNALPKKLLLYWAVVRLVTLLCKQCNVSIDEEMKETMQRVCEVTEDMASLSAKMNNDITLASSTRLALPVVRLVDKLVNWILFGFNRRNVTMQSTCLLCIRATLPGTENIHSVRFAIKKTYPTLFLY